MRARSLAAGAELFSGHFIAERSELLSAPAGSLPRENLSRGRRHREAVGPRKLANEHQGTRTGASVARAQLKRAPLPRIAAVFKTATRHCEQRHGPRAARSPRPAPAAASALGGVELYRNLESGSITLIGNQEPRRSPRTRPGSQDLRVDDSSSQKSRRVGAAVPSPVRLFCEHRGDGLRPTAPSRKP